MTGWRTAGQIAEATQGTLLSGRSEDPIQGVSTDTRTIKKGELFVALLGERDGHEWIDAAIQAGAGGILLQKPPTSPHPIPVILVSDTLRALGDLALSYRQGFSIPVIGITGSNGKTTTKEMLASILAQIGPTLWTEGNLNNLIGVPLTLFRLRAEHRFAVIEMGMNAFGEIARLAQIARPTVGWITSVGSAHLEGLGSVEGVARAKGELFDALRPQDTAIINADDPRILERSEALPSRKVFYTSLSSKAAVFQNQGREVVWQREVESLGGQGYKMSVESTFTPAFLVEIPLIGRHHILNALGAIAAALALGASVETIQKGLPTVRPTGRRLRFSELPSGVRLIDDCYNSNPTSKRAGLRTLQELSLGQPSIAVLGDMLELGSHEAEEHAGIGREVAACKIGKLFAFGPRSKAMVEAAWEAGYSKEDARHFDDIEILWQTLQAALHRGVWVLVKGSRGMKLERISTRIEGWRSEGS